MWRRQLRAPLLFLTQVDKGLQSLTELKRRWALPSSARAASTHLVCIPSFSDIATNLDCPNDNGQVSLDPTNNDAYPARKLQRHLQIMDWAGLSTLWISRLKNSCMLPGWTKDQNMFFSSGIICPSAYWPACFQGESPYTTVTCCPVRKGSLFFQLSP